MVMTDTPTYIRRVQVKNAAGELVDHEIHSDSIVELDAKYLKLVRDSERPPGPLDPLVKAAVAAESEDLRKRLEAALIVMVGFMSEPGNDVPHSLLEDLAQAIVTGTEYQVSDLASPETYKALARAYNTAVNLHLYEDFLPPDWDVDAPF